MKTLKKCLNHSFFRFTFGFLMILGASFAVLMLVSHIQGGTSAPEPQSSYIETTASPDQQTQESEEMKSQNYQITEQEISL